MKLTELLRASAQCWHHGPSAHRLWASDVTNKLLPWSKKMALEQQAEWLETLSRSIMVESLFQSEKLQLPCIMKLT